MHDGLAWVGHPLTQVAGMDLGILCPQTTVPPAIEVSSSLVTMGGGYGKTHQKSGKTITNFFKKNSKILFTKFYLASTMVCQILLSFTSCSTKFYQIPRHSALTHRAAHPPDTYTPPKHTHSPTTDLDQQTDRSCCSCPGATGGGEGRAVVAKQCRCLSHQGPAVGAEVVL